MIVNKETLEGLKAEMPFKWRVQSQNEFGATCVAYIDSRLAQDKLDEVVGGENWQTQFKVINDNLFCSVGVRVTHDDGFSEWIWKEDVGTESNVDKEKGNASDSFKRACVHFGIGRFLYSKGIQKLKTKKHTNNKFYPCDDKGNILWNGEDLSDYINNSNNPKPIVEKSKIQETTTQKKYEKPVAEPTYTKPSTCNEKTLARVNALNKEGLKGKDCLKKFLPEFNKAKNTTYKLNDLGTDELLNQVIDFIETIPPKI